MADTYTLYVQAKAFVAGGVMAGILNGGAKVLRIYRLGFINNQTTGVTGVICAGEIRKYTGSGTWTGSTAVTPIAHDTGASAGLTSVTAGHSGTPGGTTNVMRRYTWSSDEPAASTATSDEWECLIPLNILWDAGYGDANVQPLTLRQNESLIIWNVTGAAGIVDIWVEFTSADT
jgi:hypothetical protein